MVSSFEQAGGDRNFVTSGIRSSSGPLDFSIFTRRERFMCISPTPFKFQTLYYQAPKLASGSAMSAPPSYTHRTVAVITSSAPPGTSIHASTTPLTPLKVPAVKYGPVASVRTSAKLPYLRQRPAREAVAKVVVFCSGSLFFSGPLIGQVSQRKQVVKF
jgi:hypothetical protein